VRRVAIIAPIIASDVWVRQLQLHYSFAYNYLDIWGRKIKKHKDRPMPPSGKPTAFFFLNTDKLSVRERKRTRAGKQRSGYNHTYSDIIERWNPDVIIFDESHRLKRAGGVGATTAWHMVHRLRERRRGENASGLAGRDRPYVYLLTGTPNPKGYIDLFAQFRILDDSIFGTAKSTFEELYCVYGKGRRQYTIIKYKRTKSILKKVSRHSTVVSSAEAGLTGEYVPNPIRIDLPSNARRLYDQLVQDFLAELESGEVLDAPNAGVLRMRLLQITGGYTTEGTEIHNAKLAAYRDFTSDLLEQGQSLVVGARFLPEVRAVAETTKRLGFNTGVIHGAVSRSNRTSAIEAFQRRARHEPCALVFQSESGSLSIELAEAAEVLFYSLPDRWDTFWQFIQRLGGPNQKHWPVRYTSLVARNTVDMSVLAALRKKRDMHKSMMRSPSDFLRGL
jgi:SNF2 family DNA or RNA helicase